MRREIHSLPGTWNRNKQVRMSLLAPLHREDYAVCIFLIFENKLVL